MVGNTDSARFLGDYQAAFFSGFDVKNMSGSLFSWDVHFT